MTIDEANTWAYEQCAQTTSEVHWRSIEAANRAADAMNLLAKQLTLADEWAAITTTEHVQDRTYTSISIQRL